MLHHQLISLCSLVAASSKFLCCSFAKTFFSPWETQSVDGKDAPKQVSLPVFSNQSTPVLSTTEITAATWSTALLPSTPGWSQPQLPLQHPFTLRHTNTGHSNCKHFFLFLPHDFWLSSDCTPTEQTKYFCFICHTNTSGFNYARIGSLVAHLHY